MMLVSLLHRTLRIKENGVQRRLWSHGYSSKPKCTQTGNFVPLAVMDVKPVLIGFLWGVGIALSVFALEVLVGRLEGTLSRSES